MKFVLLFGCLSLGACAAFVTLRLRSPNRKLPSFPQTDKNNVVPFQVRQSSPKVLEPIRR
jgi:hypothetical protein